MAPTIQNVPKRDDRDRKRPAEKRSDLVCRVKFSNTLPDIPFDPKFITYPFDSNRFIRYNPTSLEKNYKYDLLTEHDLGVNIDLINPETYTIDPNVYLDQEDEKLLEEDLLSYADSKRSRHHNANVSWLRKTEYISTEYNRFAQKATKSETKVGFKMKQMMKTEDMYKDRDSQIQAIEKTFVTANTHSQKHHSKAGVTAVNSVPLFPDFDLWKLPFAQVIFDSDPAPTDKPVPTQMEEMSQAMIRGVKDESGEQFVAYFLPTEETVDKRQREGSEGIDYTPDEEYDYLLSREYNWNVKNKLSKGYEETYFFVFRDDGVYYNELETKVRLSKRRKLGTAGHPQQVPKSRLVVKHREMTEKEELSQAARLTMLEPAQEEDEDMIDENEITEMANVEENAEERISRSRSKSASRSKSRSKSKSPSRSRSASKSRSRSGSRSKSRSRSRSKSQSRSKSPSRSQSRSRSRSKSRSASRSRSRSASGSRSRSISRSRSKSASRSKSRSVSRSRSRSRSKSGSEPRDTGKKDEEEIFGSASDSGSD